MGDLSEQRRKAWATRRAKYGAQGHNGSYSRSALETSALVLIVRLHEETVLSEGQCCEALDMSRVEFRRHRDRLANTATSTIPGSPDDLATRQPAPAESDKSRDLKTSEPTLSHPVGGWRPIETAPKDGSLFTAYHSVWKRYAVVSWDAGERHGEPGYSETNRSSGWLIREGSRSDWLWCGATIPPPPPTEQTGKENDPSGLADAVAVQGTTALDPANMVERVARAIKPSAFRLHASMLAHCLAAGDSPDEAKATADWAHGKGMADAMDTARAAISAMREPTEAMCNAGMCAPRSEARKAATNSLDRQSAVVTDIFAAMIDEALK